MLILVDAGNTNIKCKAVIGEQFSEITIEEVIARYKQISNVIIAQVAHYPELDKLISLIDPKLVKTVSVQQNQFGVSCGYDEPKNLGIDRWLAVLACNLLFPNKNVLVVDAGTATTIDFLSSSGRHQGGVIMPGLQTMMDSVLVNTDKVFTSNDAQFSQLATNTPSALFSGCVQAQVGAIKEAWNSLDKSNDAENVLVLTGGGVTYIKEHLGLSCHYEKDLIFIGLFRFFNH